jgi:hypothetical protein
LDQLFAEFLPVIEGALVRAADLDNGLCRLAQHLLDDLGAVTVPWNRIVIPAPREATSNRSWVVGLPILDTSRWFLPIMVHELGHFAATRLEDQYSRLLGAQLLEGSWRERPELASLGAEAFESLTYRHAQELFADVFAAYCVGPAFAASLLTRAIPAGAWQSRQDYPSWGARLRAVLRTLNQLNAALPEARDDLSWVTDWIAEDWVTAQEAAGYQEAPGKVRAAVDALTDGAIEVMRLTTGSRALFQGKGVLEIGELLRQGIPPCGEADLRTVLNAAWAERLRDYDRVATIERALFEWQPRPRSEDLDREGAQ